MSGHAGGPADDDKSRRERHHAYESIRRRAIQLVEEQKIDPARDRDGVRALVAEAVREYQRHAHLGQGRALVDPAGMVDRVFRSVAHFGPLTEVFSRGDVEEVFVEGSRVSYIDGSGRLRALDQPTTEAENRQLIERLLADTDRHLDAASPIVQARVLHDSARLTAVIPPVSDRLSATLRRYALRNETMPSMVELGAFSPEASGFLW
ncbi:MAG: hypothetical protein ACRDVM_05250, partial [Acidimicrobiia bacterium]